MSIIGSNEYCGRKRAREESEAEPSKRHKIAYLDPQYVQRIARMTESLFGIQQAVRSGVPLHQEQKERLVVFVQDIANMQQGDYISREHLSVLVDLLEGLCQKDASICQSIGQQVQVLLREFKPLV